MSINALIAQGVKPIGADIPQVFEMLQQKRSNELRNQLATNQDARQQASSAMDLAERGNALTRTQNEVNFKQQMASGSAVANSAPGTAKDTAMRVAPNFVDDYTAHGGDWNSLSDDEVRQMGAHIAQKASVQLGIVPEAQAPTKVSPGEKLLVRGPDGNYKEVGNGGEPVEKFGQPFPAVGADGKPTMYERGDRGTIRAAADATGAPLRPYDKPTATQPQGFGANGKIDPRLDSQVRAILSYRAPPLPQGRGGFNSAIMNEVYARDPSYDATSYGGKSKTINSFMAGADGKQVDAVNTAVQHLELLQSLADALHNGDTQLVNQARNAWSRATGSAAPTNFETVANVAAGEVNKVAVGGPGASDDRELSRAATQLKMSPGQISQGIDSLQGLMAGRLNSVALRYKNATKLDNFNALLTPETLDAMTRHGYGSTSTPSPQPTAPTGWGKATVVK